MQSQNGTQSQRENWEIDPPTTKAEGGESKLKGSGKLWGKVGNSKKGKIEKLSNYRLKERRWFLEEKKRSQGRHGSPKRIFFKANVPGRRTKYHSRHEVREIKRDASSLNILRQVRRPLD